MRARESLSESFETAKDEIGVATHYAPGTLKRARHFEREVPASVGPFAV